MRLHLPDEYFFFPDYLHRRWNTIGDLKFQICSKILYNQDGTIQSKISFLPDDNKYNGLQSWELHSCANGAILYQQFLGRGVFHEWQRYVVRDSYNQKVKTMDWNAITGEFLYSCAIYGIQGNVKTGIFNIVNKQFNSTTTISWQPVRKEHWRFWTERLLLSALS
jgi:hypothetical protein